MQGLVEFVKTLGASRIAAMGAVTIALIGFFVFLIMRVTTPQMTPLFTDLAYEDSAAIVKELDRQAVPYELRNDVLVPKDRVARLRMSFAEGGLPKGGGVGYEIFDKSEVLGTTSFVQNINNVVLAEPDIAVGNCRIEWADGGISRDVAAADAAISAAVTSYVSARRSFADAHEMLRRSKHE